MLDSLLLQAMRYLSNSSNAPRRLSHTSPRVTTVTELSLPAGYPKDPADRVMGATAIVEGVELVTADAQLRGSHAVPTGW